MHVGWCAARPEGSEGGEGDGVREPDRRTRERESAGNGIRDRREEGLMGGKRETRTQCS